MSIQRLRPSQPLAATQAASHRRIVNKTSLSPTLAPRLAPALERVDQQQPLAPDAEQQQPLAPDASLRHDLETFMAKYGGRPAATSKLGIRVARAGNAVDNLLEGYPTLSSPTEKRASKFLAALSKGQSLTPFNAWSKYMRLRVNLKKSSLSDALFANVREQGRPIKRLLNAERSQTPELRRRSQYEQEVASKGGLAVVQGRGSESSSQAAVGAHPAAYRWQAMLRQGEEICGLATDAASDKVRPPWTGAADSRGQDKSLIEGVICQTKKETESETSEETCGEEQMVKTEGQNTELENHADSPAPKIDEAPARFTELMEDGTEVQAELVAAARGQAETNGPGMEIGTYAQAKADRETDDVELEVIPCLVCRMLLNGPRQYRDHLAGRHHHHKLRKMRRQRCAVTGGGPPDPADVGHSSLGILEAGKFSPAKKLLGRIAEEDEDEVTRAMKDPVGKVSTRGSQTLDKDTIDLSVDREVNATLIDNKGLDIISTTEYR